MDRTTNLNLKKPGSNEYVNIQDLNDNFEELDKLGAPTFEDYTGGTEVPSAATALAALKSKIKMPIWMSNVVAFCKSCLTRDVIVNNCVSSDTDKPLSAAQGKALQDQITKQNSDLSSLKIETIDIVFNSGSYYARLTIVNDRLCIFNISNVTIDYFNNLGGIPEKYRPSIDIRCVVYLTNSSGGDLRFNPLIVQPSGKLHSTSYTSYVANATAVWTI